MGMTISEKILAHHAGLESVKPAEFVLATVDLTMANDITAPLAIKAFKEVGGHKVVDPSKITLVMDHFSPSRDIPSATQLQTSRRFAEDQGISLYYESDGITLIEWATTSWSSRAIRVRSSATTRSASAWCWASVRLAVSSSSWSSL